MASRSFFIFLLVLLFVLSLSIILFELALTRIFSIVLWYDYAFMAISIAFFGLGIGSFVIHIQKDKYNTLKKKSIIGPAAHFFIQNSSICTCVWNFRARIYLLNWLHPKRYFVYLPVLFNFFYSFLFCWSRNGISIFGNV